MRHNVVEAERGVCPRSEIEQVKHIGLLAGKISDVERDIRNPVDNCIACYFQQMRGDNERQDSRDEDMAMARLT